MRITIAVSFFRFVDAQRKKESLVNEFPHLPYSTHFLAMLLGDLLLKNNGLSSYSEIEHLNFSKLKTDFDQNKENYFKQANEKLLNALNSLYPENYTKIDPRRLAASFRRGDLLSILDS